MIHFFEKLGCKILGHEIPKERNDWIHSTDRSIESSWCYCVRCERFLYFGKNYDGYYIQEGEGND